MESERNPCHFWLGIESEHDSAEWEALVLQRLRSRHIEPEPPFLLAEIVRPEMPQPVPRMTVRAG
ncbi:hypothetical protein HL653_09535 [Sphingomonas sp. AP4-R1]|uniref:hypothetical protein n=1 Tax=Sphingomonas sp. AP4-R1 TaxID=2735134 RepID=UPI001493ACEF|nr:hypothetical protein [Sphingomonas sp. AP4-R1]QJU58007.1 hypothetical protein HL653_09535 [Sphingomonas sp. AP4-R1]